MKPRELLIRSLVAGAIVVTDVLFMVLLALFVTGGGHGTVEIHEILGRNLGRLTLLSSGLGALAYLRRPRPALVGAVLYLTAWSFAVYLGLSSEDAIAFADAEQTRPMLVGFWVGGMFVVRIVVIGFGILITSSSRRG